MLFNANQLTTDICCLTKRIEDLESAMLDGTFFWCLSADITSVTGTYVVVPPVDIAMLGSVFLDFDAAGAPYTTTVIIPAATSGAGITYVLDFPLSGLTVEFRLADTTLVETAASTAIGELVVEMVACEGAWITKPGWQDLT